ncbi:hypothetical protein [Streptomyces sp. ME19-01-6]|uniref:hypothetical protein n=1 Tax=Streptomyces sp. ME19-01-6 TaxID=3028686 RepID=UPI0029A2E833|nr:hypothetical protein [Streptomyces sp. ME19-01-6]MDX3227785.1 hypothetical protein [Streptomyces sp. ME19-01-6]
MSPSPVGPDFTVRPDRVPDTSARALRPARRAIAGPRDFGADFVRQRPFASDPHTWAVLDETCVWQREKLPKGVLASLSQHSVLPAKGAGKGPVRVMAVVSVHADADSADQEMATTLEEVVLPQLPLGGAPCPEQRLNQDERIISLLSSGAPWGRRGQETADDQIWEHGEYESDSAGGPYPYIWATSRIGPVTVSVMVKGARGYSEKEIDDMPYSPLIKMAQAVKEELK